jgi:hypothetical protein
MSEKNKNRLSKKWLVSRMKSSGSKNARVRGGPGYADSRNGKQSQGWEELPMRTSIRRDRSGFSKLNTDLLVRFLHTQVGKSWTEVYAALMERIPTKLRYDLRFLDKIIAVKVVRQGDRWWDHRANCYVITRWEHLHERQYGSYWAPFLVDPETGTLQKNDCFGSRRATRSLNTAQLRRYREEERRSKAQRKKAGQRPAGYWEQRLKGRPEADPEEK